MSPSAPPTPLTPSSAPPTPPTLPHQKASGNPFAAIAVSVISGLLLFFISPWAQPFARAIHDYLTSPITISLQPSHNHVSEPVAVTDPHSLRLDETSYPTGAFIGNWDVMVDEDRVNALHIFGRSDHPGNLYHRLGSFGTLIDLASFSANQKEQRSLLLVGTVFHSAKAAANAYAIDVRRLHQCQGIPPLPGHALPIRALTCGYGAQSKRAVVYVMAVAGNIEFVVKATVQSNSHLAYYQAEGDAAYLARNEAFHVFKLLARR